MKKYSLILILIPMLFLGCEEVGPSISLQKTDRKIVIEEFTGVQCVNCPAGSQKIQDLIGQYGDQLIAVSIHSGIFSFPYDSSEYDFRTDLGDDLNNTLGPPSGYPSAVINRVKFDGQQERVVYLNDWAGFIANQAAIEPAVRIDAALTYDETTRQISIDTELYFFEDVAGSTNYSLIITEDDIKDYQLRPANEGGGDKNYKHKHVFRDVINGSAMGEAVGTDIAATSTYSLSHSYTLPQEWNPQNCNIVVMVNKVNGDDLEVLQADELDVL